LSAKIEQALHSFV